MKPNRITPILVVLVLIAGVAFYAARHRRLLSLRAAPANPGASSDESTPSQRQLPAAAAVPAELLRLRAEHQALRREFDEAQTKLRNLKETPDFKPDVSTAQAAQRAMLAELQQLGSTPDHEEAVRLGGVLATYLAEHSGKLPESIEALQSKGTPGATPNPTRPGLTFRLLPQTSTSNERLAPAFVAHSEDVPLASGMVARYFIRSDGGVLVGAVEDPAEWPDWLTLNSGLSVPPPVPH